MHVAQKKNVSQFVANVSQFVADLEAPGILYMHCKKKSVKVTRFVV